MVSAASGTNLGGCGGCGLDLGEADGAAHGRRRLEPIRVVLRRGVAPVRRCDAGKRRRPQGAGQRRACLQQQQWRQFDFGLLPVICKLYAP
jgi:hypothetical protein